MKVCINGQGHMTKMATMAVNSKNLKNLLLQNHKVLILKLGMKHLGMELYKVCINHDPEMTLTFFYGKVNLGCPCI